MSQLFVLPSLELLLITGRAIALISGLLVFGWAFRHWRRAATRDTQRVFEQLDLVRSELLIMKDVMHHAAHRVDSAAHAPAPESRVAPAPSGPARSYEIAARMVRNGAGKDELIRSCGITTHEAELLIKLHGQRREGVAELIGRQPRPAEAAATTSRATPARPQTRQPSGGQPAVTQNVQTGVRQAANLPRQTTAVTTATQRTPTTQRALERTPQARTPSLPPRSRLVAVG